MLAGALTAQSRTSRIAGPDVPYEQAECQSSGGGTSLGFQGTWASSDAVSTTITLNGTVCAA